MRRTLKIVLDADEVKFALANFALNKIDLDEQWEQHRDLVVQDCDVNGATLVLRPNADLRKQNGEDQDAV